MPNYQSYSTETKQLFCTDNLGKKDVQKVPYSTRHYWRKCYKQNEKYYSEVNHLAENIASKNAIIKTLNEIIAKNGIKKFWQQHKLPLQDLLNDKTTEFQADEILKTLQISKQAYTHWFPSQFCNQNIFGACSKKYPIQLLQSEVEVIKNYMVNPLFVQWNRTNIYLQMRKTKALLIGKNTFMKYCNKLGFSKKKYRQKCCKNRIGLVGIHFLDMIHADITYYTLSNGILAYILSIVDNFTRKLLYCNASLTCDSSFISTSLQFVINKYNLTSHNTKIVFDNGAENNGLTNTLLATYPSITKIIAKLDTPHANNHSKLPIARFSHRDCKI
jgi:hypothetical protein